MQEAKVGVVIKSSDSASWNGSKNKDTGSNPALCDFRDVEASFRAAIHDGQIPSVAFAVAKNGEIIYENAFGWADKEEQIPSTVHTSYALASASKPMVATALMMLYDRGSIDLDAPAQNYAGDWLSHLAPESSDYSLRQLLNHTAGLGTYARIYWADQDIPVRSLKDSFRRYGYLMQPPGTVSEYSNLGYGLLGHVIAEQSGASLADFLKTELFAALGMHNSILVDSLSIPVNAARKYDTSGKRLIDTLNDTPGAGNIYASAHDLVLFGSSHLNSNEQNKASFLKPQTKKLMRSFVDPGVIYPYYNSSHYGLGWYFHNNTQGEKIVWHEGGMPGASAIIVLLPRRNTAVAVLINATDANSYAQTVASALISVIEPDVQMSSFDAVEGFVKFDGQPGFAGSWDGSICIEGVSLPWMLSFDADGSVCAEFPQRGADSLLPPRVTFPALVNGNLLVATFACTLSATDIAKKPDGYLLLRLLRNGEKLSGAVVAYAASHRLEHLYPFAACLHRKSGP